MKRSVLSVPAVLAGLALLAGCGGESSSGSDPASFAPPESLIYVEGAVRPSGSLKSNVDSITEQVAGIDNLGEFVVEELESAARDDDEPVDFATEIEPWLGERAGVAFADLQDGDPSDFAIAVESTDTAATQEFIDKQVENSKDGYRDGSYEGADFKVGGDEDQAVGVVGDYLVLAEDEQAFKDAVDASSGESLADEARFADAWKATSEGSLADVYVDVGGLIERSGDTIDPQARQILGNAGIDPSDATAVASVIPGSDQVEVDLSSDLGGEQAPTGDASELLGSLPDDSFAGFAVSGFGDQLEEALDTLDEEGIPGEIPPNQLKSGLKEAGIDLESIAASLEDAAVFAVGSSESSLGGALVLTTKDSKVTNTVSNLGLLLRSAGVSGVTALSGKASGFSVRSPDLGSKPVVVAAQGERLAIGYGLPATLTGLAASSGKTLSDSPSYKTAVSALGDTPIGAFVDGPAALQLADSLVPASDDGFEEAKRYLNSIEYLALGSAAEGDLTTAKLIVGLEQ